MLTLQQAEGLEGWGVVLLLFKHLVESQNHCVCSLRSLPGLARQCGKRLPTIERILTRYGLFVIDRQRGIFYSPYLLRSMKSSLGQALRNIDDETAGHPSHDESTPYATQKDTSRHPKGHPSPSATPQERPSETATETSPKAQRKHPETTAETPPKHPRNLPATVLTSQLLRCNPLIISTRAPQKKKEKKKEKEKKKKTEKKTKKKNGPRPAPAPPQMLRHVQQPPRQAPMMFRHTLMMPRPKTRGTRQAPSQPPPQPQQQPRPKTKHGPPAAPRPPTQPPRQPPKTPSRPPKNGSGNSYGRFTTTTPSCKASNSSATCRCTPTATCAATASTGSISSARPRVSNWPTSTTPSAISPPCSPGDARRATTSCAGSTGSARKSSCRNPRDDERRDCKALGTAPPARHMVPGQTTREPRMHGRRNRKSPRKSRMTLGGPAQLIGRRGAA